MQNIEKISYIFCGVSILVYYGILWLDLYGVILSVFNSCFWLIYFYKNKGFAQFIIHVNYLGCSILYIIHKL